MLVNNEIENEDLRIQISDAIGSLLNAKNEFINEKWLKHKKKKSKQLKKKKM